MTDEAIKQVEAVLFASGKAMEEEHVKEITGLKPKQTQEALKALQQAYEQHEGALFVWNEGTRWKINVKEHYVPLVKTLVAETELDRPVLETLAVVAYRSPVLQADVVKTRGSNSYEHISELVDRGFITKEKYGRSFKLKTTEKFFTYFDVEGDKDIREAFKGVNIPEPVLPKEQKRLGDLEVVDAETDEKHEEERRKETQLEIYAINKQREDDKKYYLNGFEKRLGEVSGRISEAEGDIIAARPQNEEGNEEENPAKLLSEIEKDIEELTGKDEEENNEKKEENEDKQ